MASRQAKKYEEELELQYLCSDEDDERWFEVVGWPGYRISTFGRVAGKHGLLSLFTVRGYLAFNVVNGRNRRKSLRVHREVLRSFRGDRPNMCACHNDGDVKNCHLDNLRWDTHKGNEADKKKHGTSLDGTNHHQCKLTKEQALVIKNSDEKGVVLAARFGVTSSLVCAIRRGRAWRCLSA